MIPILVFGGCERLKVVVGMWELMVVGRLAFLSPLSFFLRQAT